MTTNTLVCHWVPTVLSVKEGRCTQCVRTDGGKWGEAVSPFTDGCGRCLSPRVNGVPVYEGGRKTGVGRNWTKDSSRTVSDGVTGS